MKPAAHFPHDFSQGLGPTTAARTTRHMRAKALQYLADEFPIFAMADQDRKTLTIVEMGKIQHPSMPTGK